MRIFSLKPGLQVRHNDLHWKYLRRLVDNRLFFANELGEPWVTTEREFYQLYEGRDVTIEVDQPFLGVIPQVTQAPPDLTTCPESHASEALRRRQYLEGILSPAGRLWPVKELRVRIKEIAKAINDQKKSPSPATITRWAQRYFATQCVMRLVPAHGLKGRNAVITGETEDVLMDVVNEIYLTVQRKPVSEVWFAFQNRIKEHNRSLPPSQQLAIPSRSSVYRYIDRLDPYLVDCARLGKRAANDKHRTAVNQMQIEHIHDRWEIDHTPLDVLLVDTDTGAVIGRPYLTVVLDRHSRMVMSFVIHIAAPNTETVLRAIDRAIRPKHAWLARYPKIIGHWPARGLPLRLVPDNAAEFHAGNLHLAFQDLGIELLYPKSRGPEKKGGMERFFKTLNTGLAHQLPGTTFSNPHDRGDYPSGKLACLTLPTLEELILKWVVDVYHQRPHRSLQGKTPAAVWKAGESARPIHLPVDLDELEAILAMRETKVLHHYGVELSELFYNSTELGPVRHQLKAGEKVEVRYRDELGHVWIRDPRRNFFLKVPCTRKGTAGLSRDLYDQARKMVRQENGNAADFDAVHTAYCQIMDDAEAAKQSNKLRQRRHAAKTSIDKEGRKRPAIAAAESPSRARQSAFSELTFDTAALTTFGIRSAD
jgi:putative transposase